jgi:hypothetical protein
MAIVSVCSQRSRCAQTGRPRWWTPGLHARPLLLAQLARCGCLHHSSSTRTAPRPQLLTASTRRPSTHPHTQPLPPRIRHAAITVTQPRTRQKRPHVRRKCAPPPAPNVHRHSPAAHPACSSPGPGPAPCFGGSKHSLAVQLTPHNDPCLVMVAVHSTKPDNGSAVWRTCIADHPRSTC